MTAKKYSRFPINSAHLELLRGHPLFAHGSLGCLLVLDVVPLLLGKAIRDVSSRHSGG